MQRDRDNRIKHRARKVVVEVRDGEVKQWLPELQLAAVFELMNGLPQRPFVPPNGTGMIERRWCGTAGATAILWTVRQGDWRPEWFPTTGTVWGCDQTDQAPTAVAERSTPCRGDRPPAMRAVLR